MGGSTYSRIPQRENILTAKAATGVGNAVAVSSHANLQIELATADNANLTVKIQASLSITPPDFSAAATNTNRWDYIASYDYNDPSSIVTGSTGYTFGGADGVKNIIVNTVGINWLNMSVTAHAAGSISADSVMFNNQ